MSQSTGRIIPPFVFGSVVVLLPLLLTATPAFGARQAQEKAARKACLTGDFNKGVSILADLFVETRNPIYLFNQGRCLEQNRRYEDAIARFEEYLRTGETATLGSEDRAAAERHVADCKARLPEDPNKAQATAPQPFAQPSPPIVPTQEPAPQPAPTIQIAEQPKEQPTSPTDGSRWITTGIITGVVGVAAVGAGVAFNLKANSMVNEMETKLDGYTSNNNSSRSTYQTLAWVGYGVGAACIATGAILVAVAVGSRRNAPSRIALTPALAPGQAGVLLRGGF